jgi:hypothetical protein
VPNEIQLAAGAEHLLFVGLNRHEVLADEPVPLVGPGDNVAQECPTQVEEDFLFCSRGVTGSLSPVGWRLAYLGVIYRIARYYANTRWLLQPESVEEST